MKFACTCGREIFDGTDGLGHKARAVADRDWNGFWDAVDAALERPGRAAAQAMALRARLPALTLYECPGCGRLWADTPGGLVGFSPDNARVNKLFAR